MPLLTDPFVRNAKAGERRTEYPDSKLTGLYLIVQPRSGVKSFAVRYRFDGASVKQTIPGHYPGVTLKAAREAATTILEHVANGRDPRKAELGDVSVDGSVANLAALYDKHHISGLRLGTQKAKRREMTAVSEAWGNRQVSSITRKDVVKLIDMRAATPNTANTAAKNIAAFLQFCVDRGELEFSPAARIKRRKVKSRDRILDDGEIVKVWRQADTAGRYGSLVQLLLLTGARRDEMASLRWSEVKGSTIELPAYRIKTGVRHNIALTDQMLTILDRYTREGEFVFNGGRKLFMTSTARKKINVAGVPRWTLHDLRRSFASGCAALGVAPHIVERCLNHGKQSAVASIYNRFSYQKEMAAAWFLWSKHVEVLVTAKQAVAA